MTPQFLLTVFLDPRGRCDRRGLLTVAGSLLALQAAALGLAWTGALAPEGDVGALLGILFIWGAIAATSKRVHDIGLSAWWIGGSFLAVMMSTAVMAIGLMCLLPQAAFEPGETGYLVVVAGNALPIFALCIWLHCVKGQAGPNRFGEEPGPLGFSVPAVSQSAPLPAAAR